MRKTTVKKDELLATVKENRKLHIQEYKEACDGYKVKAIQRIDEVMGDLKNRVGELRDGEVIALMSVHFGLEVPVSHEKDYDQVIKMLEMSIDETVTLESDEFSCYVMDDWDWKQQFTHRNSLYKA